MNNMPAGYKQTEVGVIPEDWGFDYIERMYGWVCGRMRGWV